MGSPARIGLVGPGRRHQGLGPFLAAHVEAAGARLVAAAGRDCARTRAAARDLAEGLGHRVEAFTGVSELLSKARLDALIVASPIPCHLEALEVALSSRVPVLCEKPLVGPGDLAIVPSLLDRFARAGVCLMEHCQWPEVLPAFWELHPRALHEPVERVEMLLAPAATAARQRLLDSLSHFLSLLQSLVPVDRTTEIKRLVFEESGQEWPAETVSFVLERPFPSLQARLFLQRVERQPRPAWLSIDGARMDRQVRLPDYAISFGSENRLIRIPDPSASLVYRFVQQVREADSERARDESFRILQRARLFGTILGAFDREHC